MSANRVRSFLSGLAYHRLTGLYDLAISRLAAEQDWKTRLGLQVAPLPVMSWSIFGSGTGTLALLLKSGCPGAHIHGVDPDPRMAALARAKARSVGVGVEFHQEERSFLGRGGKRGVAMQRRGLRMLCAACVGLGSLAAAWPAAAVPDAMESAGKPGDQHAPAIDWSRLERRLTEKGIAAGSPIMIRIFKIESELEVWMQKDGRFELLAKYPICFWSGTLGPKLTEGDRQSPEGLYSVSTRQLHKTGRWRRSLDIGFPNTFDRAHGRTGSYILVHGGCTSTGCYAMTNPVMEEIYALSEAALRQGQEHIQMHVFPFRMTQQNLAAYANSEWSSFWASLRPAYDLFETTRVPPHVSVCNKQYVVSETEIAETGECSEKESEVRVAVHTPLRRARTLRGARRAASRSKGLGTCTAHRRHVSFRDRRAGRARRC